MFVAARDVETGEVHHFAVNFAPKHGAEYMFVWLDGTRRVMQVDTKAPVPEGAAAIRATFDVPSHEVIVQTGR
jgi:hypothetical protein